MIRTTRLTDRLRRAAPFLMIAGMLVSPRAGIAQDLAQRSNLTPGPPAVDQGLANSDEEIALTIDLKVSDEAGFDKAVQDLYDPASPTYQHWMTDTELQRFAPSPVAVAQVKAELQKQGLTIVDTDPNGFSLQVRGRTGAVQRAFQTSIHQFSAQNKTFISNVGTPKLSGGADQFVAGVSGLTRRQMQPLSKRAVDARTEKAIPPVPLSKVNASGGLSDFVTNNCFTGPDTFVYNTPNQSVPTGAFFGNTYDNSTKSCGFLPSQLQKHYGLPAVYKKGFDGEGQTVVIVDAFGYPDILNDANAFSSLNGLPALDSSNFKIVYPSGKPSDPNAGIVAGWDTEIALDVEWVHSIAPKAKIVLVIAIDNYDTSFQAAENYVVCHKLGNSVSNSWGGIADVNYTAAEVAPYNRIFRRGAARGIAFQFSTGDDGDFGLNTPVGAAAVPADSPYVTGVGGTSILRRINGKTEETGWGNYLTRIARAGLLNPPVQRGFVFGAGGGESSLFAKPSWQAGLPGTGRQLPDVSALGDPYTGVPIIFTEYGTTYVAVYGGTSLACPIFSAIWALADQAAGHSLGQAAPRIARMNSDGLRDIVPVSSPTNLAGVIFDKNKISVYSPRDLFSEAPFIPVDFVSANWPYDVQSGSVLSFATDTSLTVGPGWDNVTGFGVPNGLAFIEEAGK